MLIRQEVDQECAKKKNEVCMAMKRKVMSMINRDGRDYEHGMSRVRTRNRTSMMDRAGEVRSTG